MDKDGSGVINMDDLKGTYTVDKHPKFKSGEMTEDQILHEFLAAWGDADGDDNVTKEEFSDYYRKISAHVDTDEEFVQILTSAWKM